jgi:hypothetical protein
MAAMESGAARDWAVCGGIWREATACGDRWGEGDAGAEARRLGACGLIATA